MSYQYESKNGLVSYHHFDDGSVAITSNKIKEISKIYTIIDICNFQKGISSSLWITLRDLLDADFKILITLYDNINDD